MDQQDEYYKHMGENSQNLDNSDEDLSDVDNPDGTRTIGKRRSKNDNQGRDFKCKYCEKTYLSYPALYTHMKQKHSKGPDGELRNPPTSGRGRGRPRKNPYQRLDPRTEDFFKAPERDGGPVDPLCCFEEIYFTIFQYNPNQHDINKFREQMYSYPIYKNLVQFSNMVDPQGRLLPLQQRPQYNQQHGSFDRNLDPNKIRQNGQYNGHSQQNQLGAYGQINQSQGLNNGDYHPHQQNNQYNQQKNASEQQNYQKQFLNLQENPDQKRQYQENDEGSKSNDAHNENDDKKINGQKDEDDEQNEGGQSESNKDYEGGDEDQEDDDKSNSDDNHDQNRKEENLNGNKLNGKNNYQGNYNTLAQYHQQQQMNSQNNFNQSQPNQYQMHMPPANIGQQMENTSNEAAIVVNKAKWQRNYDLLNDSDRQEMLVDEIFALYLYRMSNRINQNYYKIVLAYVIFFRECLNEYGWGKKIESECIKLESNPELKSDIASKQFCLVNNAEHAPEICNEFVTVYMEYKKSIFDIAKHDQIDLTINLCHWLFQCQFTCSKLTMIG